MTETMDRAEEILDQSFAFWLKRRDEEDERRRQHEMRQMQEPFIPWPDVRARLKCSDEVWARIRRMNPDHRGIKIGEMLRGYRRHDQLSRAINLDVIGPKEFIARWGREAYRAVPKSAFIRHGHRKALSYQFCLDLPGPHLLTGENEERMR